jgi:HSP20 family protein
MNIIRYQTPSVSRSLFAPLTRFSALSDEMDRLFQAPFFGHGNDAGDTFAGWTPAVDLFQDKDSVLLRAELPGLRREDIHVSLHEDVLTLSGERREEKNADERGNLRSERFFGRFERRFTLPVRVDGNRVAAHYEDGILTVTLPKAEEAKPRQIEVNVK